MLLVSVVLDRQFIKDDRRSSLFYSFLIPPWQCFDRLVFTISMRTWIFQYRASIPAGEVAEKDLNINAPNHFLILNYRNGWSFDKNSNYILVFGRRLPPFPSKAAPGTGTNFIALHTFQFCKQVLNRAPVDVRWMRVSAYFAFTN